MFTTTLRRATNTQLLRLRKNGPTISFAAGVAGSLVATYLACRSTLKLEKTLDHIREDFDNIKNRNLTPDYDEDERSKDLVYATAKAGVELGKLYAPAVGVQLVSVGLLTGSHVVMRRRNTNLMLAYAALDLAFKKYRDSVERADEDRLELLQETKGGDRVARLLAEAEQEAIVNRWSPECSPYARFFDETGTCYEKNAEINRIFIEATLGWANNRLEAEGYLFLNDVYRSLGLEESGAGQVVGWVLAEGNQNHVDFGLWHPRNNRFINNMENACILDFNVDGVIFDSVPRWARSPITRRWHS